MRRADRLFALLQLLRRHKLTTARRLADELEISERTVYRDIRDLAASGVPIDGEAGVGYRLRPGFHLPPLMFTRDEIEALALGARIVAAWSDPALGRAAEDALVKIEAALPDKLRPLVEATALFAPANHAAAPLNVDLAALRGAVRDLRKLCFVYTSLDDEMTRRTVRPLSLLFYGRVWLLLAWCELRQDFRSFRLDRMAEAQVLDERFRPEAGKTFADYLRRSELS